MANNSLSSLSRVCISGGGIYTVANTKESIPTDSADCVELDFCPFLLILQVISENTVILSQCAGMREQELF